MTTAFMIGLLTFLPFDRFVHGQTDNQTNKSISKQVKKNICKWWTIDTEKTVVDFKNGASEITQWEFFPDSTARFLSVSQLPDSSIFTNTFNSVSWTFDKTTNQIKVSSSFFEETTLQVLKVTSHEFVYSFRKDTLDKIFYMIRMK